jgi:hypothetical protein
VIKIESRWSPSGKGYFPGLVLRTWFIAFADSTDKTALRALRETASMILKPKEKVFGMTLETALLSRFSYEPLADCPLQPSN